MPKPKSKTSPKAGRDPRAIELRVDPNDQAAKDAAMAQAVLRPSVLAALTIKDRFPDDDNLTVAALTAALAAQNAKIRDGDMARPEAMLIAQAHTLDTLFAELVGRSRANSREGFMNSADRYMRLALKAQGQCRTTLQTLSDIKNPRPYIQNNQAQYQQVNNATPPQAAPRAGKPFSSNELLEDTRHEHQRLDLGAPQEAGPGDTVLEAVDA
jgi:hypothetical protein